MWGAYFSGVEEVDAVVPSSLEALLRVISCRRVWWRRAELYLDNVALLGPAVGQPAAQGEDADLETRWSQVAEDLKAR